MKTFKQWLTEQKMKEMAGTDAVYDGKKHADFQWQGAPESMIKKKNCGCKKANRVEGNRLGRSS